MLFITYMTTLSFTLCIAKWDLCCQSHDILSGENFNSCRPPNMTHIQGTDVLWLLRWKLFGTCSTVIKSPSENSTPYIKALSECCVSSQSRVDLGDLLHRCSRKYKSTPCQYWVVLFCCCPQQQYLYTKATGCNNHGEPHLKHLKQLLHWSLIMTSL